MGAHSLPRELYWVLSSTQLVGHLRFASHWHERAQGHCGYCMYQVCSCLASFSNPCTAAICTPSAPQLPSLSLPKPPRAFSKRTLSLTTHIPEPVFAPPLTFLHSLLPFREQGDHPGQTCWVPRHHSSLSSCCVPSPKWQFWDRAVEGRGKSSCWGCVNQV